MKEEKDPNGKDPHEGGAKLDAGKTRLGLVLGGFARALDAVGKVGTKGAAKYCDNGWLSVPDGESRYIDAEFRHIFKHLQGEVVDPESGFLHLAHNAWNSLAVLELALREAEARMTTSEPAFVGSDGHTYVHGPEPMRFKITKVTGKGKRTKVKVARVTGADAIRAELAAVPVMCNESFKIEARPKRKRK